MTLALAVGANGAIFAVVRAVLLRDLPFAEASRLVALQARQVGDDHLPFSIPDFLDLASAKTLDGVVGWSGWSANLTGVEAPVRIQAQWATRGFFELLGIHAALGRTPTAQEQAPGAAHVALLSDGLWRTRFGADPAILGRNLTLNGESFAVIGILPPEFPFLSANAQLIAPLILETDARRSKRGAAFLRVIARLREGSSLAAARAELNGIAARLRSSYPETNGASVGVAAVPLTESVVGGYRAMLLLLQGAAVLVLLIACMNLANLLLARVLARRGELAARIALGAGRRDLVRLLLAEAAAPAALGGLLGGALAAVGARAFVVFGPAQMPRGAEVSATLLVVATTFALAVVCGLAIGVLPAIRGGREAPAGALRGVGRASTPDRARVRARFLLVALEAGLALVLLVASGLLLRSLQRLRDTAPGFTVDHLVSVQLSLPRRKYADAEAISAYADRVSERLRTLPGVAEVAAASVNPFTPWRASINFGIEGSDRVTRERPAMANYRAVAPGYFHTLGVPVIAGRDIAPSDGRTAVAVAVVSDTLARTHFPGRAVLGSRLRIDDAEGWRTVEIVGVVGDVKHAGLDSDGTADVYVPYRQTPPNVAVWLANIFCVAVRTSGDPSAMLPSLEREIRGVDRDVATSGVRTMADAIGTSLASRRFSTDLVVLFGSAALMLALLGIFAVTSFAVAERRREIGVRVSLGARRGQILSLYMREALRPVVMGLALGAAAAFGSSGLLANLLFGVEAHDLQTLVAAAATLSVSAAVASFIPAWRASTVDPATVLRQQ